MVAAWDERVALTRSLPGWTNVGDVDPTPLLTLMPLPLAFRRSRGRLEPRLRVYLPAELWLTYSSVSACLTSGEEAVLWTGRAMATLGAGMALLDLDALQSALRVLGAPIHPEVRVP